MKNMIIELLMIGLFAGCNNSTQKTLEVSNSNLLAKSKSIAEIQVDKSNPKSGIKYKEDRVIDPSNKPIVLKFHEANAQKVFNLEDFYSTVEYIQFKSVVNVKGQESDPLKKIVCLNDKYIIVAGSGDYPALYCFDKRGLFLFKVRERIKSQLNESEFKRMTGTQLDALANVTISDNNCIYMTIKGKESRMNWLNLDSRKVYAIRQCDLKYSYIISADKYINNEYFIYGLKAKRSNFLYSFNFKGDTLCNFKNYNKVIPFKDGNAKSPEGDVIYYYNGKLTIRQACNDTIFRVISEKKIIPVYIMDLGKERIDIYTSLYGDHDNKIIPTYWLESNNFIFFEYSFHKMSNRLFYDKTLKKIFKELPTNDFVKSFWVKNTISNCLPITKSGQKIFKKTLFESYSKNDLENMIQNKMILKCNVEQKKIAKNFYDKMASGDLLVLILKEK